MDMIRSFPGMSIMLCLFAGIISSGMKRKAACYLNSALILAVTAMNAAVLYYTVVTKEAFVFVMGKFPAPWGNELRAGMLEAAVAVLFCVIMLLSVWGGRKKLDEEVETGKHNLYYVLLNLLLSSLLALVYTNDLFTAYVFVEINTISACGLIMISQIGRTLEAAVRYMIMSLLGSGMLLLGICMLYDLTGHLLMSNIHEGVLRAATVPEYRIPLVVCIALMVIGLSVKSALFPFHAWLPDAYGYSTVSSAAILSSLVSKGYIFLLIKIIYRVIGFEFFCNTHIINVLFIFGIAGIIFGSLSAIKENDIRRMIAFSSVAQIGYIYMGIGLGSELGMAASVFHIFAHALGKALLFISAIGLTDVSGCSRKFIEITGSGYRNKVAGLGFTVGSLSMVGIPIFAGFVSKLMFARAAVGGREKMLATLIALAISTILNSIYFMKTVIRIYTPNPDTPYSSVTIGREKQYAFAIVLFMVLNIFFGMMSQPIVDLIHAGIAVLG